ncbi:MAG: UDP-N-acetylmuramoyl-tripeptide--D-alanyl-D-alanine ligase, partial [Alphaproteobacteria bacterium]|nr:UDP-N-acetylmuramoyl-tripeptide--D-alanyl-D-alanine ligase [Alphaproteobacteria bacterium]
MLTLKQIAAALELNSLSCDDQEITGIAIDSRTVRPGNLFVALQGQTDGHDYIPQAITNGAIGVVAVQGKSDPSLSVCHFFVNDTLSALKAIGVYARNQCPSSQIVAITGSSGKTTVKEYANILISPFGKTVATEKSFNGSIGVPYSLAHLSHDTQYAIIEVGMNQRGEIAPLVQMVRPQIAVITAIYPAHTEGVGTLDDIALEKSDILSALTPGCTAILPYDSPYFDFFKNKAEALGADVVSVGLRQGADVHLEAFALDGQGAHVQAQIFGEEFSWVLPAYAQHYALNALFATAIALKMGLSLAQIKEHIHKISPLPGRGQIEQMTLATGGCVTVIDDSYNANIGSMKGGLSVLSSLQGKRKIAVLGAMGE